MNLSSSAVQARTVASSSYFFMISHCRHRSWRGVLLLLSTTWTFFSSWATQNNHTPQWPLSPNMEPSLVELPSCNSTTTDLRNTSLFTLQLHHTKSPALKSLFFVIFTSILTLFFIHSMSTRNRFPTHTSASALLYCNFSWEVCP